MPDIHLVLVATAAMALLMVLGFGGKRGSGNVVTESRDVTGFRRVKLTGMGELQITQGGTEGLEIEAEDNILPLIESSVVGDELRIGFECGWWWDRPRPTKPVRFRLAAKELAAVHISGAGTVEAPQLQADTLAITVTGSGKINVTMAATEFRGGIVGSGEFTLAGTAERQRVDISGSGKYRARDLQSQTCEVKISGSGNVEVAVAGALDIRVAGSGTVGYVGSPTVTQHTAGAATIRQLKS